jgi:hypothetical protein
MHSLNQTALITSHIGRAQHTTEVQVQEHLHVLTVRLHQNQGITAVLLRAAVAVEATAVEAAAEAVVVHIQVDRLRADQVGVQAVQAVDLQGAVPVRQGAVHHRDVDKVNSITLVS